MGCSCRCTGHRAGGSTRTQAATGRAVPSTKGLRKLNHRCRMSRSSVTGRITLPVLLHGPRCAAALWVAVPNCFLLHSLQVRTVCNLPMQFELTARLERERLEASLSEASAAKQRLTDQLAAAQQVMLCLSMQQPPVASMNSCVHTRV